MGMRKLCFLVVAFVLAGSIPSICLSEDVFAPVRKIYMNDGKLIECQMGWLDGDRMICRKFGGNVTLPLVSVDFEKTFPKYKKTEGETVLLVHPGAAYQDENIVLSNLRVIRTPESPAKGDPSLNKAQTHPRATAYVIVFEILNRGDPCEVRVVINVMDTQGKILHQIDVPSESRLDAGESSVVKTRLDRPGTGLENRMSFLKVSQVERKNIPEDLLNPGNPDYGARGPAADGIQDKVREEKIRALKELFLKERP